MRTLIFLLALFLSLPGLAAEEKVERRLDDLEERVLEVEADLALMRKHTDRLISRATLGYLNAFYLKAGLSLLFPRDTGFVSTTDTGLGVFVGAGKYFGEHHVVDVGLDWDFYAGASARYRFELHFENPHLTIGPMIGAKLKLLNLSPFDRFISNPAEVKSFLFMAGVVLGFPVGRSLLNAELAILLNGNQRVLTANAGIHFFY